MAELHVQPRKSQPWWLWALVILAVIAAVAYFTRDDSSVDAEIRDNPSTEIQ